MSEVLLGTTVDITISLIHKAEEEYWKDGESHIFEREVKQELSLGPGKPFNVIFGDPDWTGDSNDAIDNFKRGTL